MSVRIAFHILILPWLQEAQNDDVPYLEDGIVAGVGAVI